ncbi:MAG: TraR/DksA C4-type zinc finger protein [Bacteroidetes bacterium]|nr:TraR/DksA C4-type zinc finger protein [Bacteroidota bacterium]
MSTITFKPDLKGYWTLEDYQHFYNVINKKRDEILEDLNLLREQLAESSQDGTYENKTYSLHMADQGTDAMEREKTFLFASREGKILDYLERAVQRLQEGTYGYCKVCGKPMEKGRLEAVPHSQICVPCKSKQG